MMKTLKYILCVGAVISLGACATTQLSETTATFGQATVQNKLVHAVPATDQQKQNTYIPADRARQDLARKRYKENKVEEPVAVGTTR